MPGSVDVDDLSEDSSTLSEPQWNDTARYERLSSEIAQAVLIGASSTGTRKKQHIKGRLLPISAIAADLASRGSTAFRNLSLSQLGYAACGLASTFLTKCNRFLRKMETRWAAMWTHEIPELFTPSSESSHDSDGFSVRGSVDSDGECDDGSDDFIADVGDPERPVDHETMEMTEKGSNEGLDDLSSLDGFDMPRRIAMHSRSLEARGSLEAEDETLALVEYASSRPLPSLGLALRTSPAESIPSQPLALTIPPRMDVAPLEIATGHAETGPFTGVVEPECEAELFVSSFGLDLDLWDPGDETAEPSMLINEVFKCVEHVRSSPPVASKDLSGLPGSSSSVMFAGELDRASDRWQNRELLLQQPLPSSRSLQSLTQGPYRRNQGSKKRRRLESSRRERREQEWDPPSGSHEADSELGESENPEEHDSDAASESEFDEPFGESRHRTRMKSAYDIETRVALPTQPLSDLLMEYARKRRAKKPKKKRVFDIRDLDLDLSDSTYLIEALRATKPLAVAQSPRSLPSRRPRSRPIEYKEIEGGSTSVDGEPLEDTIDVGSAFGDLHSSDIDNVMRGGNSEMADDLTDALIRMPPAAGRVAEFDDAMRFDDVFMEPLPVSGHETENTGTDFALQVIECIKNNDGQTTFHEIFEEMHSMAGFSHYSLGDFVHALTMMDEQITVAQNHALSHNEPIYIRLQ